MKVYVVFTFRFGLSEVQNIFFKAEKAKEWAEVMALYSEDEYFVEEWHVI